MGGKGSGGRRVGSGRKKGNGPRMVVVRHPSAPGKTPIDTLDPPAELQGPAGELHTLLEGLAFLQSGSGPGDPNPQIADLQARIEERQAQAAALAIWHELAPHAVAQRTLTPATAAAFAMLCRAVVLERALGGSPSTAGGANHRGLMHRVATWKKDFCLQPFGRPLVDEKPSAKPVSKWAG